MPDEELVNSDSSVDLSTDLSVLTDAITKLNETLEVEEVEIDEEALTEIDLLNQIVETLQPSDEEVEIQNQMDMEQGETSAYIVDTLSAVNDALTAELLQAQEQHDVLISAIYEGSFFIGLSVVISLGIYMFWNQLSKW